MEKNATEVVLYETEPIPRFLKARFTYLSHQTQTKAYLFHMPIPQVSLLVWSYKFWSMLSSPSNLAFSSRTQPDKHWSNKFTAYRNHLSLEASSIFKLWSLEVKTSKLRAIVTCWYLTTFPQCSCLTNQAIIDPELAYFLGCTSPMIYSVLLAFLMGKEGIQGAIKFPHSEKNSRIPILKFAVVRYPNQTCFLSYQQSLNISKQ